jgi:hypothetical protein
MGGGVLCSWEEVVGKRMQVGVSGSKSGDFSEWNTNSLLNAIDWTNNLTCQRTGLMV